MHFRAYVFWKIYLPSYSVFCLSPTTVLYEVTIRVAASVLARRLQRQCSLPPSLLTHSVNTSGSCSQQAKASSANLVFLPTHPEFSSL
jgi:hypothetical protein